MNVSDIGYFVAGGFITLCVYAFCSVVQDTFKTPETDYDTSNGVEVTWKPILPETNIDVPLPEDIKPPKGSVNVGKLKRVKKATKPKKIRGRRKR